MIVESQWIVDPMIILYSIQGRGRGDVHFVLGTTKVDKKVNILMLSNRKIIFKPVQTALKSHSEYSNC